jgi:PPM family protein phosphatase
MTPVGAKRVFSAFTHQGRRRENQDAVLSRTLPDGRDLFIVADGMGGHLGGSRASSLASTEIARELSRGLSIWEAVDACQTKLQRTAADEDLYGMGTTVTGALIDGSEVTVFNVGDSRAYFISAMGIEQVTEDHSFVAESVKKGTMSEAEALRSRWANALTRSLGGDPGNDGQDHVDVDVFGAFDVREPAVLLLCSDGLYKSVPDHLILKVVLGTPDVAVAARALASVAFRRGSDDNISAILCEFGSLDRRGADFTLPDDIEQQWAREIGARSAASPLASGVGVRAQVPGPMARHPRSGMMPLVLFLTLCLALGASWFALQSASSQGAMNDAVTGTVNESPSIGDDSEMGPDSILLEEGWEYLVQEGEPIIEDATGGQP